MLEKKDSVKNKGKQVKPTKTCMQRMKIESKK